MSIQHTIRSAYRKTLFLMPVLLLGAVSLHADIAATASFTDTQPMPGTFEYDITLNNTGTTTIGTFWFSWIPGQGFMSVAPTSVQSPAGWNEILTNGDASIQFTTTTSLLALGASQSGFMFDSSLSPTDLETPFAGPGIGIGDPVATSFVYIAAPLADPGAQLVAMPAVTTATPEPSTVFLFALGMGLAGGFRLRRRT